MHLDPAVKEYLWYVSLFSVLAGACIASIAQAFNGWRERAAANRRHLRDLAVQLAIKQWEHELSVEEASRPDVMPDSMNVPKPPSKPARPLRVVMFEMLRFADAVSDNKLTARSLANHIADTTSVLDSASSDSQIRNP